MFKRILRARPQIRHSFFDQRLCSSIAECAKLGNYSKFNPDKVADQTDFIKSLASAKKLEKVSDTVSAFSFDSHVGMKCFGSNTLFIRDFYPDLFAKIRKHKRVVLLGNPGIGKSFFQFYYLARLVNPSLFGPLPPDAFGSTAPPRIVIRQEGTSAMMIYDLETYEVERVTTDFQGLLRCFDPKTSLYLMEPGESKEEPHFVSLQIPTLTTCSPDIARYKEFCKNGGVEFFLPTFELDELLSIGKFMLDHNLVPEDMVREYTPEKIKGRFLEFGGIFRHVLPNSMQYLHGIRRRQRKAIADANLEILLRSGDMERSDVSHFLMQYKVQRTGDMRYGEIVSDFVSPEVVKGLHARWIGVDLMDKVQTLQKNDESGYLQAVCPKLFEDVVANLLFEGKIKELPKLEKIQRGNYPEYDNMEVNVLYVPLNTSFPFVEMFYKSEDGPLNVFQLTRQENGQKLAKETAIGKFLEKVGLADVSNVHLFFIRSPTSNVIYKLPAEVPKSKFNHYTELTVFGDYGGCD